MKILRTYLAACNFCDGVGMIKDHDNYGMQTTPLMKTCPVCNGAKVIPITETVED